LEGYQLDSEKLTPVYFDCEINSKIQNSPPLIALLWRKVKSVAFKNQRDFPFYAAELAPNNPSQEREIFSTLMNPSLQCQSISFDYNFRCELEKQKSFSDKLKYYESLLEKSQGLPKIVECWKEVMQKEKKGQCSDFHLLMAWALQRERESSETSKIWTVAVEALGTAPNQLLFNQIARFGVQTDKVFLTLRKYRLEYNKIWHSLNTSAQIEKLINESFPVMIANKFKENNFVTLEILRNNKNRVQIFVDVIDRIHPFRSYCPTLKPV
jgi:hypothetical protein